VKLFLFKIRNHFLEKIGFLPCTPPSKKTFGKGVNFEVTVFYRREIIFIQNKKPFFRKKQVSSPAPLSTTFKKGSLNLKL
jgi:hypothetical protein